MKRTLLILAAATIAAAALVASMRPAAVHAKRSGFLLLPPAAPAGQQAIYGHIKTLTLKGSRFVLRFDPAWFTSGVTANTAAA